METTVAFGVLYHTIAVLIILPTVSKVLIRTLSKVILVNKVVTRIVRRIYKDIIFDTKPIARKVYKNSENRTFLAVFAVFVVIRLAPSDPTRSVADTVDVAPVRLAQGIIK